MATDESKCAGSIKCPGRPSVMVANPEMKKPKWLCEIHYQELVMSRGKK